MRLTRREFAALTAGGAAAAAAPRFAGAETAPGAGGVTRSHGESLLGKLKYGPDFPHFDYVNPNAPKGGIAKLATRINFDSFNPFIVKGVPPAGVGLTFDTLMDSPLDEGSTQYGLLAEWFEFPDDFSWAAYRLRDDARWNDGVPVTVEDIIFTFEALTTMGDPQYRFYYANVVSAKDLGDRVVRFDFDTANNRELPHIMGQLRILPKHWWEGRTFDEASLDPLLGSGPYRISAYEKGRFVEYERVPDYWAADLPVNVGYHNLDRIRYEIFLDDTATFEAFKSGAFDFRDENSSSIWALNYDFPAVRDGRVQRAEVELESPKATQAFAFNLRRGKFQDRRVREAISLAYDFAWTNKTVHFGHHSQPTSYFQGTEGLMQAGAPEGIELEILADLRGQVPDEVFGPAWAPPKTDGSGRIRRELRKAGDLLKEAGYVITGGKLMSPDGEPFEIEFLSAQDKQSKVINPFIRNLSQLGIQAKFVLVDGPQYIRRVFQDPEFDWDMALWVVRNSESPGNEQREFWGSETATKVGARNVGGVANPAVDILIDRIIFAKDRETLEAASRALDRVLLWNHYMIPQLYASKERIAWWDRFGHPDPLPPRAIGFPTVWWWDEAKAAATEASK